MRPVRLFFVSFLIAMPALAGDTRVFVSLAGTLLEAEITSVAGDNVTLKRASDSQTLVVNRRTLCKEDGEYITRWQEQHVSSGSPATTLIMPREAAASPAQKFRIVCLALPSKSNRGPASGDHRVFEHTYSFNLSNQEVSRDLQNARGLAVTLAKNVAEPNGDLIVLQREEFDISLRAQSKLVHTTQPVRLTYSQDPNFPYGVKSYGYVLIIRDAAGAVLHVQASPDSSARFTKEILSITQTPCVVDREFKVKSSSDAAFGYISY